jgi:nucleoid-associated protein YgaU
VADPEVEEEIDIERRKSALALPAAVLLLTACLVVSLAVFVPPATRAWRYESSCDYDDLLRKGLPPSGTLAAVDPDIVKEDFQAFLQSPVAPDSKDPMGDPWLFAALVMGYLRLHNIPLWQPAVASLYSTTTRTKHVVQDGDTWSSLASTYLGDAALWPLLMLLNRDLVTIRGAKLETGRTIYIGDAAWLEAGPEGGEEP